MYFMCMKYTSTVVFSKFIYLRHVKNNEIENNVTTTLFFGTDVQIDYFGCETSTPFSLLL